MKKYILFMLVFLSVVPVHSQITKYSYSCGNASSEIVWEQHVENGLLYLTKTQGVEVQKHVIDKDHKTVSWEYFNSGENTQIKITLQNGTYHVDGVLRSKSYAKTFKSNGKPWFQHIGFVIGYIIEGQSSVVYECIRPDNLKLYEMQADVKETKTNKGMLQQRVYTHLTGRLAKFFGTDYYINPINKQFIRYEGVHGAPGTPKTTITIKK